jgi:hypothetical protein
LMVARGGIEPPTRGFSDRCRKRSNLLDGIQFTRANCGIFWEVTVR